MRRSTSRSSSGAMKNGICSAIADEPDASARFGRRQRGPLAGQLEEPRHVGVLQLELLLERLQELQLGRWGALVGPGDRGRQAERQLARGTVGQAFRDRAQDGGQLARPGHLLRGVGDGLPEVAGMDAAELGPLEHPAVDLLDLDLADVSVRPRGEDHRLEQRRLARLVGEVDVAVLAHGWPPYPLCPATAAVVHGRAGARYRHEPLDTARGRTQGAYRTSATVMLSTPPFAFAS